MQKEIIYIEAANVFSYGYNGDHLVVLFHFDGFRAHADGIEEFMIDFPMHEEYYDAMKYYCGQYEKYMLNKFAEK